MCYGLLLEDLNNLILVTIAMKKNKKNFSSTYNDISP